MPVAPHEFWVSTVRLRSEALDAYSYRCRGKEKGNSETVLLKSCNSRYIRVGPQQIDRMLEDPQRHCPKLHAVAKAVAQSRLKTVVLVRASSYRILLAIIEKEAAATTEGFRVATMEQRGC